MKMCPHFGGLGLGLSWPVFFFLFSFFALFRVFFLFLIFFFGKMGDVRRTEGKETVMVNGKKES